MKLLWWYEGRVRWEPGHAATDIEIGVRLGDGRTLHQEVERILMEEGLSEDHPLDGVRVAIHIKNALSPQYP